MYNNVPDDWGMYWKKCSACGHRYHASDGGCDCWEERREEQLDELEFALSSAKRIAFENCVADRPLEDEVEDDIAQGEKYIYLYVDSIDGKSEEYCLTTYNWEDILKNIDGEAVEIVEENPS